MLARSVTLNLVGTIASLIIGFASSLLVARWLGSADRGLFGLMQSAAETIANVAGLGVPFAVVYHAARKRSNQRAIFGNGLAYTAVLAAVFIPIAWLFHDDIAGAIARGQGGRLWILAAVVVPMTFLYWTTHNQLHAALRFGALNALLVLSKLAALLAVVVGVGVLGGGVAGALAALIASSLVAAAGTVVVLRGPRPTLDGRIFRELLHYGVRAQVGTIFQVVNYRLDVFILQIYRPLSSVGYYVVAQIVAELTTVLAAAFQATLLPLISHQGAEDVGPTITALRHHTILAAAATVANVAFGSLVIVVGYGPEFRPALVPMLILLPGIFFLGTGEVVAGDLRGRNRPGLASGVAGLAFVVTIALDFLLIPRYGIRGAALASLCAYTTFGLASLVALSRVTGLSVRTLAVPTRVEFAAYPQALRTLRERLRRR